MAFFLTFIMYFGAAIVCSVLAPKGYYSKNKKSRKIYVCVIFIIPVLISTFRSNTGTDSLMYMDAYNKLDTVALNRWNGFEIGFKYVIRLLNSIGLPYESLFFVMSFLLVLFVMLFINNEKEHIDVRLATFIFMLDLFLISNNIMRQTVVVAASLYAISLFFDGKNKKSIIIILLSSLIHISGYITLFVIGVRILTKSKKYKFIIVASVVISFVLIINRTILASVIAKLINPSYAMYLTSNVESGGSFINYTIKYIFPIILFLGAMDSYKFYPRMKAYSLLTLVGYICLLFSVITGTQVQRIGFNFLYINIALFAYVSKYGFKIGKSRFSRIATKRMIILYNIALCLSTFFISGFNDVVPYYPFR